MTYSVKPLREAGLQARWTKTSDGRPIIVVRNPNSKYHHQRETWWVITNKMWEDMKTTNNIVEAFTNHTLLGDIFSVIA